MRSILKFHSHVQHCTLTARMLSFVDYTQAEIIEKMVIFRHTELIYTWLNMIVTSHLSSITILGQCTTGRFALLQNF